MIRFSAAALITGVLAGLVSAIILDERIARLEHRLDAASASVVCRLPARQRRLRDAYASLMWVGRRSDKKRPPSEVRVRDGRS